MKQSVKNLLIASAVGIVVLGILLIFMGVMASFIIAGIVELLLFAYLSRANSSQGKADQPQDREPTDTDIANKSLFDANLQLRKKIISKELRTAYEALIDQLVELLPLVNDTQHTSELAWVINRMATEYLPKKSIEPYLALNKAERLNDEIVSTALNSVESMQKELLEVKAMITSRNTAEFSKKATFLKHRFTES